MKEVFNFLKIMALGLARFLFIILVIGVVFILPGYLFHLYSNKNLLECVLIGISAEILLCGILVVIYGLGDEG